MAKKQVKKRVNIGKIMLCVLIFLIVAALGVSITFNVLQAKQNKALNDKLNAAVDVPPNPDDVIIKPDEPTGPVAQFFTIAPRATVASASNSADTTITCTPNVPDAVIQISWSVAWKNPESEWATGKNVTDYVRITPTAELSPVAVCSVRQAFGEQAIIKATLVPQVEEPDGEEGSEATVSTVEPREISATCTVDYACRYGKSNIAFKVNQLTTAGTDYFSPNLYYLTPDTKIVQFIKPEIKYSTSVGTVNKGLVPKYSLSLTEKAVALLDKVVNVYNQKFAAGEFKTDKWVSFDRQSYFRDGQSLKERYTDIDNGFPMMFGNAYNSAKKYFYTRNNYVPYYCLAIFGLHMTPDNADIPSDTPWKMDGFWDNFSAYRTDNDDFASDLNLALSIISECVQEVAGSNSDDNNYVIDDFFTFSAHFESEYTDYTFTQSLGFGVRKALVDPVVTNVSLDPSQIVA